MIVTTEEAKAKWCPMVRYIRLDDLLRDNRPGEELGESYCIADQCMMWTFAHTYRTPYEAEKAAGNVLGYCGLAPP